MTDELLMQCVKEGDLSQAAVLFHRYHQRIYRYLGKLSGNYTAAEDLTQTVFEKLIHYRQSYNPDQKFENWVFKIARNAFVDQVKLNGKLPRAHSIEVTDLQHISEDQENTAEQDALLTKALNALPPDDRDILVLTRFEKLKYTEVATIIGTTEANVKIKVFRAIEKLRNHYFKFSTI
jgi:RNA polymerase sigma-70 factor (ECF subfamily)